MTPEELELERETGRIVLAAAIPFATWRGLAPRGARIGSHRGLVV